MNGCPESSWNLRGFLMPRNSLLDAFSRLKGAEDSFLQREFLAPVAENANVRVRVAGVCYELSIDPADFSGWGVFRPASHRKAVLMRDATLDERRRYLELLPQVRLILCDRHSSTWYALPAQRSDVRLSISGVVPIRFAEDVELFETVATRFDGANFWFEDVDGQRDPGIAAYLRRALGDLENSENLARPGLTPEERLTYTLHLLGKEEAVRKLEAEESEGRLREALAHAGAELIGYLERRDVYRVTYTVDGAQHISAISRDNLTVESAGICLDGGDRNFDLQSLVGVLREARNSGDFEYY